MNSNQKIVLYLIGGMFGFGLGVLAAHTYKRGYEKQLASVSPEDAENMIVAFPPSTLIRIIMISIGLLREVSKAGQSMGEQAND